MTRALRRRLERAAARRKPAVPWLTKTSGDGWETTYSGPGGRMSEAEFNALCEAYPEVEVLHIQFVGPKLEPVQGGAA